MSEKEVLIVHDDVDTISIVRFACERAGLFVLGGVTTMGEAFNLIAAANHLAALFVDGNLSRNQFDGAEGRELAEYARKKHSGVIVASISGENHRWSDFPNSNMIDPGLRTIVDMVISQLNR